MSVAVAPPVHASSALSGSVGLWIVLLTVISHTVTLPVRTSSSWTSYRPKLFLLGCGATSMNALCTYQHCTRCVCRVGGAKVLLLGVLLWSIGTLAAPPLAHISLFALCASRVFVSIFTPLQCLVPGQVCYWLMPCSTVKHFVLHMQSQDPHPCNCSTSCHACTWVYLSSDAFVVRTTCTGLRARTCAGMRCRACMTCMQSHVVCWACR